MNALRKISFAAISSTDENFDWKTIAEYSRKIEQAGFSAFVIKENVPDGSYSFEPLTLVAALSILTKRIGLVATASTNDSEPYHIARRLASLDHISVGRAGWNIDTDTVADKVFNDKETNECAEEFLQVVKGLWDSYADGAVVADKQSGVYFLPNGRWSLNHKGKYFQVAGPLNVSRSPQGYPVIFHSVTNKADIAFSARNADVVLISVQSVEDAVAFRKTLNNALANTGRAIGSVQVWLEIAPVFVSEAIGSDRQYNAVHSNHWTGTAEQIANQLTEWHQSGAVDGFALQFPMNDAHTDKFIKEVLPILTHHNLFRVPKGDTLRELIGIGRPKRQTI